MKVLKAVGLGFRLTHRLWFAILFILVALAVSSLLNFAILPYGVGQDGKIQVVEPVSPPQAMDVAGKVLLLYLLRFGLSLFFFGGIIGCAAALLRKEGISPVGFLQQCARWFFPTVGWIVGTGILALGPGIVLGLIFSAGVRRAEGANAMITAQAFLLGITFVFFAVLMPLFYAPVSLAVRRGGFWDSFGDSFRFSFRHLVGNLSVFACCVFVGCIAYALRYFLGEMVNGIRGFLHIAPNAPNLLLFLLSLLVEAPLMYLTVFSPCLLCAYYHTETTPTSASV